MVKRAGEENDGLLLLGQFGDGAFQIAKLQPHVF
jgi:hypothetical protein